jgi:hypothetical protein
MTKWHVCTRDPTAPRQVPSYPQQRMKVVDWPLAKQIMSQKAQMPISHVLTSLLLRPLHGRVVADQVITVEVEIEVEE